MEIPRGANPESEPSQPEQSREELEKELKILEAWLATQEPGLQAAMKHLTTWIDKCLEDKERAEEIRKILDQPSTGT